MTQGTKKKKINYSSVYLEHRTNPNKKKYTQFYLQHPFIFAYYSIVQRPKMCLVSKAENILTNDTISLQIIQYIDSGNWFLLA